MRDSFIIIKDNKIPTLLAISDLEQQIGLMDREDLPPSMSFPYPYAKINKFWMKSTPKPLDIVFCCNGRVVDICKGEPHSTKLIGPDLPTDLVVEFPYGTCNNLKIKAGDEVSLPEYNGASIFAKRYY